MRSRGRRLAIPLLVWWLWLPAGFAIWLFFVNVVFEGYGDLRLGTWRWFDAWFVVDAGQRWFYLLVGALGTIVIVASRVPVKLPGASRTTKRQPGPPPPRPGGGPPPPPHRLPRSEHRAASPAADTGQHVVLDV
ncbi:hypothetical protein I6A60_13235, partial [Frankia sp. AgB1.9]|nr:hypothetical protein [Frankia sp. AgB1.9]